MVPGCFPGEWIGWDSRKAPNSWKKSESYPKGRIFFGFMKTHLVGGFNPFEKY